MRQIQEGPRWGLWDSAGQADRAQQDDQVGNPSEAIPVKVGRTAIVVATKVSEKEHQVCSAYEAISREVGGAPNLCHFAGFHEPIAVVVDALVGSGCTRMLEGVVVVAVADVVVGVVVVVNDTGTVFKGQLTVVVNAGVTGFCASECANRGAIVQHAIGLLCETVNASGRHGGKQDGGFVSKAPGWIGVKCAIQSCRRCGNVDLCGTVAEQHEVIIIALGLNCEDRACQCQGQSQSL